MGNDVKMEETDGRMNGGLMIAYMMEEEGWMASDPPLLTGSLVGLIQ